VCWNGCGTKAIWKCTNLCQFNTTLSECPSIQEYHPVSNVDETLAQLAGAKKCSKLDTNSGFWQIPLAKQSRSLIAFGLQGALYLMDDVLVFGRDQEQHKERFEAVLRRTQSAGITLNPSKCEFSKNQMKFLGHVVNKDGVRANPRAVVKLPPASTVK